MKRMKLTAVRLSEIPFNQRMIAARIATKHADDDNERAEILMAAMFPSDKLFWVVCPTEQKPLAA